MKEVIYSFIGFSFSVSSIHTCSIHVHPSTHFICFQNTLLRIYHILHHLAHFYLENFNYGPLVWMFSHAIPLRKVEALQKRRLGFLYDNYNSPSEKIFEKSEKVCMEFNRLRYLCIVIYKLLTIFIPASWNKVSKVNQVSYGEKIWDIMGLKSGTPFCFMSGLVKILKLSKTLLKIGMVVCNCRVYQTWAELILS